MKTSILRESRLERLRVALRMSKNTRSRKTEKSYVGWMRRFIDFAAAQPDALRVRPEEMAHRFVAAHADGWAVATQDQFRNALVFYYREVLGIPLGDLGGWAQARRPVRLPVWLPHGEMMRLIGAMRGVPRLMAMVAYGGGPRSMELVRARLKDVDLAARTLTIRGGKGMKDRVTILPDAVIEPLRLHMADCMELWQRDRQAGWPGVEVPSVKFSGLDMGWFWLWPAARESRDPVSGVVRRHHTHESTLPKATTAAVRRLGMPARVTVHSYRHSFATSLLAKGTPIQEVQQLLGHVNIATTQIYAHCLPRVESRIRSPMDDEAGKIVAFQRDDHEGAQARRGQG